MKIKTQELKQVAKEKERQTDRQTYKEDPGAFP